MRDATRAVFDIPPGSALPSRGAHAGLYLERCAPLPPPNMDGKLTPTQRADFLAGLCAIEVPAVYRTAFSRWREALVEGGAYVCDVEARSRILVGHGNPSGAEVGLTLHPTYGVPYLPGSALKGLLNHWMNERGMHGDPRWKGVGYDAQGRPEEPPGTFHREVFGGPPMGEEEGADGAGSQGALVFEDAWIVPAAPPHLPLALDVLTPHQKDYYRTFGGAWPDDWTSPIPVNFASVRPGTRFLLAVSAVASASPASVKVAGLMMKHLLDALARWGIGGKTAAGYGRLRPVAGAAPRRAPAAGGARASAGLKALREAVARVMEPPKDDAATPIADRFQREFGDDARLDAVAAGERDEALQALRPMLAHPRLNKRYSARIAAIRTRFER